MSAMSINSSISLSAMLQMNLAKSANSMNTSALRLTTGLKINSMADGAASYIIASNINQSIRGWQGAQESTQKGISLVNTTKSALNSMRSTLNELSGIANTASSNTLGAEARKELQDRADLLISKLYIQKDTSRFDGIKIFGDENNLSTISPGHLTTITTSVTSTSEVIGTTTTVGTTTTSTVKEVVTGGLINSVASMSKSELEAAGYTVITSAAEFKTKIEANPSGKFALSGDLDFIGVDHTAISNFSGELNGNGFAIKSLEIINSTKINQGLFGTLTGHAVVKNLIIESSVVIGNINVGILSGTAEDNTLIENVAIILGTTSGDKSVGGLVGSASNSATIKNSYSTAEVGGVSYIGGLVGETWSDSIITIQNCYATGDVTANEMGGGLIGSNSAQISNSWASGNVTKSDDESYQLGGLVGGQSSQGSITNSYATGNVTAGGNYSLNFSEAGGLVGGNDGNIMNSYATGNVTGLGSYVGGLVGLNNNSTIKNSYATGAVSAGSDYDGKSYAGGLVGSFWNSDISNSYATGDVGATGSSVGGLIGYSLDGTISNSYATGKVAGFEAVGGFIGLNGSNITSSYAVGNTKGSNAAGGFAGVNNREITSSWSSGNVDSSSPNSGGFVGILSGKVTNSYAKGKSLNNVGFAGAISPTSTVIASYYNKSTNSKAVSTGSTAGIIGLSTSDLNLGIVHSRVYNNDLYVPVLRKIDSEVVESATTTRVTTLSQFMTAITSMTAGKTIVLMADIDFQGSSGGLGSFAGTLDGNGYSIKNISGSYAPCSLITSTGTVKDLVLENINITGTGNIGALAGVNDGIISNVTVKGGSVTNTDTTQSNTGGLVGQNNRTIIMSQSSATVNGNNYSTGGIAGTNRGDINTSNFTGNITSQNGKDVGGLVGLNFDGEILNCYTSTGTILVETATNVGGLVGSNPLGNIDNCYSSMTVKATGATTIIGGLVGVTGTKITNSYFSGTVEAALSEGVGGIVGVNYGGTIEQSYNKGNITGGNYTGGIAGASVGTISKCYNEASQIQGGNFVGGLVGQATASSNITLSYSTSDIIGLNNVGGFAGSLEDGSTVENSYATGNVSGNGFTGGFVGMMSSATTKQTYSNGSVSSTRGESGGYAGSILNSTITNGYWNKDTAKTLFPYYQMSGSAVGLTGLTNAQMTSTDTFTGFDTSIWNFEDGRSPTLKNVNAGLSNPLTKPQRITPSPVEGSIAGDAGLSNPTAVPPLMSESQTTQQVVTTILTSTTIATTTTQKVTTTEEIKETITGATAISVSNADKYNQIYTYYDTQLSGLTSVDTGMTFGNIFFDVSSNTLAQSSADVINSLMSKVNEKEASMNNYLNNFNTSVQTQKDNIKSLSEQFTMTAGADMEAEEINYTRNEIRLQNISSLMMQTSRMRYAPILMLLGKY